MQKRWLVFLLALLLAIAAYFIPLGDPKAQAVISVTVFVVILWITEVLPLHVTALLAAFLLIIFGRMPEKEIFANFFDPAIVLLLGGFVIAVAMTKHKLDHYFAHKIMNTCGNKSSIILFGILISTAFISMWISNTAAAALMMPIAIVFLIKNRMKPLASKFGKAAVLAVAYGATIGGIGTIVGSTPNILAAKYLNTHDAVFGFFDWFYRGFPFMIIMILIGWIVLLVLFKPEKKKLKIVRVKEKLHSDQKLVLLIFAVTIILWMTEKFHGISSANVSIVPIVLLYSFGMLGFKDFAKVDWESLILVGGGLALGYGIHAVGLDSHVVSVIKGVSSLSAFGFFLMMGMLGILLTIFISNTTAAALYVPIVVALASTMGVGAVNTVVVAAIGVSLDFVFPFGAPPSEIAYATKYVRMKDMAKAGIVISIISAFVLAALALLW